MTSALDAGSAPAPDLLRAIDFVVFDFDGVFTDNLVYVFEDGREAVRCTRADGLGLARLREVGIGALVLSTETNPVVPARCRKLKIDCVAGCEDKAVMLKEIVAGRGLDLQRVAFVGNDINDSECLAIVGLPIVVADAHPDVMPLARYRTRAPGGHGAVREVCDLFYAARR